MKPTKLTKFPRGTPRASHIKALALGPLMAVLLAACQPEAPQTTAVDATSPPSVPVISVSKHLVDTGPLRLARIEASERVEVLPRVSGHIEEVLFTEGDLVERGQALFRIDPRPFEAAVAQARATLELASAEEQLAASEAQRARQLAAGAAIAIEELERREARLAQVRAQRAHAAAVLQGAELELEFAVLRAPIDGRIGRALVTAGNFVSAGPPQAALATIVATDALHVHFDVADRTLLSELQRGEQAGAWQALLRDRDSGAEIARARLDYIDNEVDAGTGALRLRATLEGDTAGLLPGQFVLAQITGGKPSPRILVPEEVIGTDQGARFVLVVARSGEVEYRPVQVGGTYEGMRVIDSGLEPGELVITSGLMRVRPGMVVAPEQMTASLNQPSPANPI